MVKYCYSKLNDTWTTYKKEEFVQTQSPWIIKSGLGDLTHISGLIPNSFYDITINDLELSFLVDTNGNLYFNDNKDPLPMNCIKDIVKITPRLSTNINIKDVLFTFNKTTNKIDSRPMKKKKKMSIQYQPKYNWSSVPPGPCKTNEMELDIRNFFPENTAIGHWKKKATISVDGQFGFTDINKNYCNCVLCRDGRFTSVPKDYQGTLEMECNPL